MVITIHCRWKSETWVFHFLTFMFQPPSSINWFLSHRQKTGQGIALALFHELKSLGDTAFLDIKTEFDLHNLEKCVELSDYFLFILSEGIFESEYCFKGNCFQHY